jgi:hypothetical protein
MTAWAGVEGGMKPAADLLDAALQLLALEKGYKGSFVNFVAL